MKTKTIIEGLTQEELVDLLCTATYGSNWLCIYVPDWKGLDGECMEDIWAKALLDGRKIACTDYNADEGESYGTLEHYTEEDGQTTYLVSLQDILDGLQKCADGSFKADDDEYGKREKSWLKECFNHFIDNDSMEMDQPEAEAIVQVIMFGELIYG